MKCDAERMAEIFIRYTRYQVIDELYHYTDIDCMENILQNDKVVFRMTNINDFSDKMESKSIEVYFDLAIEQLYIDGVIDLKIKELLSSIKIDEKHLFSTVDKIFGGEYMKSEPYDVYVLCFTTDGNSSYMTENYIRNSEHKGCIIHVNRNACGDFCKKSHDYLMMKVIYGKEVIDNIYKFIKDELICGDKSDEFINKYVIPLIVAYIHQLRYCTKLSKFKSEKEIRLIKYIPKTENYDENFKIEEINGKCYGYIELERYGCWDVRLVGNYKTDETQRYCDLLSERQYRVI